MRKVEERGSKERARDNSRAFVRGAGMERRYDEARGPDSRALRGKWWRRGNNSSGLKRVMKEGVGTRME